MKSRKSLILSCFIWGSGQFFVCKQHVKGILFFLVQALVIGIELQTGYWLEWLAGRIPEFNLRLYGGFFTKGIWGIITLGEKPGAKTGDHSMMLMISGVIVVLLLIMILGIFVWNLRDAWRSGREVDETGTYLGSANYFKKL